MEIVHVDNGGLYVPFIQLNCKEIANRFEGLKCIYNFRIRRIDTEKVADIDNSEQSQRPTIRNGARRKSFGSKCNSKLVVKCRKTDKKQA